MNELLAGAFAIFSLVSFVAFITTARRLRDTERWLNRALRTLENHGWGERQR